METQIVLDYYDPENKTITTETGFRYLSTKSVVKRTETFDLDLEDTEGMEALFKIFYDRNNSLRYCNGTYWKFRDPEIDAMYRTWYKDLPNDVRFKMFYGNGVVD